MLGNSHLETDEWEERLREMDERLNDEADAVQDLIAENARVAQNQDGYRRIKSLRRMPGDLTGWIFGKT